MTIRRTLARTALLTSSLLLLAACNSGNDTAANAAASPAAAPASATASPASTSAQTVASSAASSAADTTLASGTDTSDVKRPAPPVGFPPGPTPQQDKDYILIDTPDQPSGDKVQVTEVFGYGCPHCNALQPRLSAWEKTLPTDVQFSYLPAAFGPGAPHCWDEFARAFYAAQAMGIPVAKFHDGIYKAIWGQGDFSGDCSVIPKAFANFGADPATFSSTAQSFAITAKIGQAHDQEMRWGVDATPMVIVDGKYRVFERMETGPDGMLHTIEWLIAKQRPLHARH